MHTAERLPSLSSRPDTFLVTELDKPSKNRWTQLIIALRCRGTVCDILITSLSYLTALYLFNPKPVQLSCYSDYTNGRAVYEQGVDRNISLFRVFRPSLGSSQLPNRELFLRGQRSEGVKLYHHYHVKARQFAWLGFELFSVFLKKHYTAHSPTWTHFSPRCRVHICNMSFFCIYKPRLRKPTFRSKTSFSGNEPALLISRRVQSVIVLLRSVS